MTDSELFREYTNKGLAATKSILDNTATGTETVIEQMRLCREAADNFARALKLLREYPSDVLRFFEVVFKHETRLEAMICFLRKKAKELDANRAEALSQQ